MAAPVSPTRAQYRTETRRLLHDATGKFWSDVDLNDYINAARYRTCSDTGCIRRLVTAYLSKGLEVYPIGGVTGGFVTAPGAGYTTINITVTGDGSGATAIGVLSPIGTASPGGSVVSVVVGRTSSTYNVVPQVIFSGGGGSGAAATAHMTSSSAVIASSGSGYSLGDILTIPGTNAIRPATCQVVVVGVGGSITTVALIDGGEYLNVPTNPISVTGGTGTGASVFCGFIVGKVVITNPGSGYATPPAVTFNPLASLGPPLPVGTVTLGSTASSVGGQLTSIIVTNAGVGYTNAAFAISGNGYGAQATAGVIPADTLDIMNVTPIWGNLAPPLNYQPWTEFNAKMRLLRATNQQRPCVWSRYGTSGGSAFLQPIPDQMYVTEFDTAILPQLLTDDITPDAIAFPYTTPVAYYAAWKAKYNQQQFAEAQNFLNDYRRKVMEAQASVQMRRVPNPYAGYSGG